MHLNIYSIFKYIVYVSRLVNATWQKVAMKARKVC